MFADMGFTEGDRKWLGHIGEAPPLPSKRRPSSANIYFVIPKADGQVTELGLRACTWNAVAGRLGVTVGRLSESPWSLSTMKPGEMHLIMNQWE